MTRLKSRVLQCTVFAAVLTFAGGAPVGAQSAPMPSAPELIARYVQALGGREAMLRPQTTRARGAIEMPAAGLRGDLEMLGAQPDRMLMRMVLSGIGEVRTGFDGTVGWAIDPIQGARLLAGAELDAMREQATATAGLRDAVHFREMQTVERTTLGGQDCFRVRLVWVSGRESSDCYAVDTGLLVATSGKQATPMGEVDVVTLLSQYRDFGGVQMPTRMVQQVMGQEQVMTISEVDFAPLPAETFALPAEIRALRAAQP